MRRHLNKRANIAVLLIELNELDADAVQEPNYFTSLLSNLHIHGSAEMILLTNTRINIH